MLKKMMCLGLAMVGSSAVFAADTANSPNSDEPILVRKIGGQTDEVRETCEIYRDRVVVTVRYNTPEVFNLKMVSQKPLAFETGNIDSILQNAALSPTEKVSAKEIVDSLPANRQHNSVFVEYFRSPKSQALRKLRSHDEYEGSAASMNQSPAAQILVGILDTWCNH